MKNDKDSFDSILVRLHWNYITPEQAKKALYELVKGAMPGKSKGKFVVEAQDGGHWVETDEARAHNQAIEEMEGKLKELFGEEE